jgi:hypothetical protein
VNALILWNQWNLVKFNKIKLERIQKHFGNQQAFNKWNQETYNVLQLYAFLFSFIFTFITLKPFYFINGRMSKVCFLTSCRLLWHKMNGNRNIR